MIEKKLEKFHKIIYPLLKCIKCDHEKLQINNHSLKCKKCGQIYPIYNGIPVMTLDPNKSINFDASVIVSNQYSSQWMELIKKADDELVLDLGSGYNLQEFKNVVKLEIFCFPNVDVVASAECLPFKNASFKMVISGAVFEHIRNVKAAANSIYSVLKPNGEVYIETAFLQPMHAYPDHYYNMTISGIENLFSHFEKIESGIREHQYPSFTIKWILQSWVKKLPRKEREKFLNVTVGEIIKEYSENPFSKKWLSNFRKHDLEELACGVYYYGKKKK